MGTTGMWEPDGLGRFPGDGSEATLIRLTPVGLSGSAWMPVAVVGIGTVDTGGSFVILMAFLDTEVMDEVRARATLTCSSSPAGITSRHPGRIQWASVSISPSGCSRP
jgi:hypothetical protein